MNKVLRFWASTSDRLPDLAAEVSVANTEIVEVAETLVNQAATETNPTVQRNLLDAAWRLLDANRKVNDAVEKAIAPQAARLG